MYILSLCYSGLISYLLLQKKKNSNWEGKRWKIHNIYVQQLRNGHLGTFISKQLRTPKSKSTGFSLLEIQPIEQHPGFLRREAGGRIVNFVWMLLNGEIEQDENCTWKKLCQLR